MNRNITNVSVLVIIFSVQLKYLRVSPIVPMLPRSAPARSIDCKRCSDSCRHSSKLRTSSVPGSGLALYALWTFPCRLFLCVPVPDSF